MVSPRSFHSYYDENGHQAAWFSVCKNCNESIVRECLPKFSISNGFCIGSLPDDELQGLTLPERFMTQLVSISAMTRVMRGGRHRCIRSHCIAFDCTPGPPINLLPRSISDVATFRVAMVGDFTEAQSQQVKKMHAIRGQRIRDVFSFYRLNNRLYSSVAPNDNLLNELIQTEQFDHIAVDLVDDEGEAAQSGVSEEQQDIRGHSDDWRVASARDELHVVERRIGLSDAARVLLSQEHEILSGSPGAGSSQREFLVKRSNQLSMDVSGDLLAKMFPHLFPYGHGHPGDDRRVPVSLKECIKHYTLLSGRKFAEDELFTLVAFDRISMRNMYTQNALRCQRFPQIFDGYEAIEATELKKALLENEQRLQGQRSNNAEPKSLAHKFLKTVEIASAAVWGSNAERSKCRQKAIAYQTRYGQPSLFLTLTPNTDNSLAMAYYAGKTSVRSLFDVLEAKMPSKAELREASLGNDCASARLFMHQVNSFIEHVLGIDPVSKKQMQFRGLLGEVSAFFGMVETQGRGTLHIHFLIWLVNAPASISELEEALNGPDSVNFRSSVTSYVDSIVRNRIPLPLTQYMRSQCGASFSELCGLDIPPRAQQNPRRGKFSARAQSGVSEPALVYCRTCKTKFSSQHILRSVLLQSRPLHWPLWERELSAGEVESAARLEVACRESMKQALSIVSGRERAEMALRIECDALKDNFGLTSTPATQLLHEANTSQMRYCSSEDDPFQNDELTRLIEITPPMLSDNRMAQKWMDYMVSVLVVLLNQHWWCHTSSCFKMSKSTVNDSYCRYSFPRSRKSQTTFDFAGVELERTVAHEYINGFNYEIMATFKCNHDIQVLLGGKDAADRIHYCTKYVTKQQKRLDSVVVMALAAFRRRQERETIAISVDRSNAHDSLTTARKRVASMVYAMTNRQEIAGPLAALYLYRDSCCYESSGCSYVPLRDIVHQLCSTEEYSCRLVRDDRNDSGSSRYVAVSFMDDYIYRPEKLDNVNVYEFAMKYYRKKDDHSGTSILSLKTGHPLHRTHSLATRRSEVVPVIQGFRLAYVTESSPDEFRYKHAILSLVLFKPFRQLSDLISSSASSSDQWLQSFDEWLPTRSSFVRMIMSHIDDYHCGVDQAKQQTEFADISASTPNEEDMDDSSSDDDDLFSVDDFGGSEDESDDCEGTEAFVNPWLDDDTEADAVLDSQDLHPVVCPTAGTPDTRVSKILGAFNAHDMLTSSAQRTVAFQQTAAASEGFPSIADMRKWVRSSSTDCNLREPPLADATVASDTKVVELLANALDEGAMTWNAASDSISRQAKEYATVSDISRQYTLNEKQHYAFKRIGSALLNRWRNVEDMTYLNSDLNEALERDQLRMFLGGEGGTGKSRILDAVQALCRSWHRPDCIVKTALTGKAATVIGGRTLASLLIQLRRKKNTSAAYIDVVVVDEVSMMRKSQLAQLDKLLRSAKRISDVAFGGVHIVLVGDFLQLPPVGADPLYKDPSERRHSTANEVDGYSLWLAFCDVIILEESVRFRADSEWGRGCQFARQGVWLPEFVDIINFRVVGNAQAVFNRWSPCSTVPTFITPDNKTRLSINNLFIATTAKLLPEGEYPVRVVADFKGKLAKLGSSEVKMVMALPDSKFGRMAPYLDLIVGMPVQLTQNIRAEKMAANGTHGTLETIIFSPGTTFRVVHDRVSGMTVKLPSVKPPAVIVRIPRGGSATSMQGCVDSDLFPLFSNARPFKECDIKLPPSRSGKPRSLRVQIDQFPLVCSVSATVYKVQGETLNDMVVTEWRSENHLTNKPQQPYLLVSRVTSRKAFRSLSPITKDIITWAHPPKDALDEEKRLQRLSEATLRRLRRK